MAGPEPDLRVKNVTIKDDTDLRPASFGQPLTTVTFFVGDHGPFRFSDKKEIMTAEHINGLIEHQVVELRRITGVGY